jgi:rhodanese-related sulfurtransferase
VPPELLKEAGTWLIPSKATEVVTYCASPKGHASADAAPELTKMGYTNVRYYADRKQDSTSAGMPVERGA